MDYGLNFTESFARYDPNSCSWKMSQLSLLRGLIEFLATWPPAGMMRNGIVYQRRCLALPMSVKESLLWPTPTASMATRGWSFTKNSLGRYSKRVIDNALSYGPKPQPTLQEWLMGFPIGWTDLEHSETP